MTNISREELKKIHKQMIPEMEQKLHELLSSEEYRLFYHHRSEDRIILSHAGDTGFDEKFTLCLFIKG